MKPFVQYQIEIAICMAAFALLYLLLWRKETNFHFKRFVLLSIPLFSILIPLINWNIDVGPKPETSTIQYITYLPNQLELVYTPIISKTQELSGWEIAFWILSFGAIVMSLRLLISYLRIIQIYQKSTPDSSGDFRMIDDPIHSFSFFNMIVINKDQANSREKDYILAHEKAHKKHGHSWDILWLELIKMAHWFNPVIWLLSNESKKNLEYLADQEVTLQTGNPQHYQYAIVQHASQSGYQLLKTQFSKTNLKNRIIMMNQPNNQKISSWKLFAVLPLLGILLMSFSIKIENLDIKKEISEALPSFETTELVDEKIFELSEVSPSPDGKQMNYFYEEIYRLVEHETGKSKDDINGNAITHFIVMKDGSLRDIKLIEGINKQIDKTILQFIKDGPKWTPGLEVGEPVNVRMVLPIQFGNHLDFPNSSRKISGKLVNEQDFTAIRDAKIKIKGTDIETKTDEAGMFSLVIEPDHGEIEVFFDNRPLQNIKISPNQSFYRHLVRLDKSIKNRSQLDSVYHIVDEIPQPVDGMANFYKVIDNNLRYPENAKNKGISGKVFVELVVLKDGTPDRVKVVKGIDPECDAEAVRLVKSGPRWTPGIENGDPVNVRLIIPVTFNPEYTPPPSAVYGSVKDENGNPIPGCNIVMEGTTTGTVTDLKGKFLLEIPPSTKVQSIVIASRGYETETLNAHGGTVVAVVLQKVETMGATDDVIEIKAIGNDLFGLEKSPLYIVDGVEVENFKHTSLNPEDIVSISVLKDSSATNIYGEKAKDGVVIITTKNSAKTGSGLLKLQQNKGQSFNTLPSENSKILDPSNLKLSPSTDLTSNSNEERELVRGLSIDKDEAPLIFIDGGEVPYNEIKEIDPQSIESIEVLKDETVLDNYGEKGKNGVIKIKLKPGVEFKPSGSINNFKDNPPLIIVDGVETELSMENLNENIHPQDIKSISVLKDTSATNIYGDKGKNGVILIELNQKNRGDSGYNLPNQPLGSKVYGQVLNEKGEPIENALVSAGRSQSSRTDKNGTYEVVLDKTSFSTIQAYAPGYIWTEIKVDNSSNHDIILNPMPLEKIKKIVDEKGPQRSLDENIDPLNAINYDIVIDNKEVYAREHEGAGNFEKYGQELGKQCIPDSTAVSLFGENAQGGLTFDIMR